MLIIEDGTEGKLDIVSEQAVDKITGDIRDELDVGELVETVDEREGIEVIDNTDFDGVGEWVAHGGRV